VHGSEKCWRKIVACGRIYKTNTVILGGDLTGKAVIPIIKQDNGTFKCSFQGQELILKNAKELEACEANIWNNGFYTYITTLKELEELTEEKKDEIFQHLMIERLERWLKFADEKLKGTDIKIYVCPGNDDSPIIDPLLTKSEHVVNIAEKLLEIDGYEIISLGWTNPTPWNTPRECSEEELAKKIEFLASQVQNMENCIFNFHAPPFDSGLDYAPALDSELRPKSAGREVIPVGSKAVRKAIEQYQPLLGLHGHIHESPKATKIGRTLCLNPGSQYMDGIVMGIIVNLDKKSVKSYMPVQG
jgi:Icc-related predicted phosphoesterase